MHARKTSTTSKPHISNIGHVSWQNVPNRSQKTRHLSPSIYSCHSRTVFIGIHIIWLRLGGHTTVKGVKKAVNVIGLRYLWSRDLSIMVRCVLFFISPKNNIMKTLSHVMWVKRKKKKMREAKDNNIKHMRLRLNCFIHARTAHTHHTLTH